MAQRLGAWWIAAVTLPLVLAGLVLMHTVDLGPGDDGTGPGDHAAAGAPAELHGEHGGECDDCHVAVHVTAACVAVLGSIAVWRVARRLTGGTTPVAAAPSTAGRPEPPPLLHRGRPPWVELGVMLC